MRLNIHFLCGAEVALAAIAAAGAFWEPESILLTGPLLAATGLAVGLHARRLRLPSALGAGLAAPLGSGLIAGVIATFRWGPEEARIPVGTMLTMLAVVVAALARRCVAQVRDRAACGGELPASAAGRFSIRTALGTTTAACVLLAAAKWLPQRDTAVFLLYAGAVLALSAATAAAYVRGMGGRRRDADAASASPFGAARAEADDGPA